MNLTRYIYGWAAFFRAIWMARHKKRGAGKMSWANAIKFGATCRHVVDGQWRDPPRKPRWLRHRVKSNARP